MNLSRSLLAMALAAASITAYAHDPKEHAKEAEAAKAKPDCEKLKTMDTSKMDPNDPVLKAMQAKCDAQKKAAAAHSDDHDHEHGKDDKQADVDHGGH